MKWTRIFVRFVLCVLIFALAPSRVRNTNGAQFTPNQLVAIDSPAELLTEANHLSGVGNWYAAGPLYSAAEARFHAAHESLLEIHAHLGRVRSEATRVPLDKTLARLSKELNRRAVANDRQLQMWGSALMASIQIDSDSKKAKGEWAACLQAANALGKLQWAARARGELGVIAFLEGNTAKAVNLLGGSILSAYRSGDRGSQIRLLSMLGLGFNEEHRFSEALSMFKTAIATAEQTPDSGFPFLAYRGEAAALAGLSQVVQSRQLLTRALTVAEAQDDRVHEADLMAEAGRVAIAAHDLQEAETDFRTAARIAGEMNDHRTVSEIMFDLAGVERKLGQLPRADAALRGGIHASRLLGDRYYLPRDLTALAEIEVAEHKYHEADHSYEQAEDVLDNILANQHSFEENTARAGSMSSTYLEHFLLAQRMGNVERAFQIIERVRGRFVASKLSVQQQSGFRSPKITKLQSNIAATQLELLRTDNTESRSSLMNRLLADERNLAYQFNEAGLKRREVLSKPASLKSVRRILKADELFAEYVLDDPEAFCIVATRSSSRLIKLPAGSASIRDLTREYLSKLRAVGSGAQFSGELYRVLLAPVIGSFPQSRFIISPDDALNALPFEALHDEHGFLIQSKVVSYTPSGTVLWLLRNRKFHESNRPLLAVGAVDYKLARALPESFVRMPTAAMVVRGLAEMTGARLADLPGSRDEVLAIAQIAGNGSQLLLGDKATESGFKSQALSDFRIIHFATHAAADQQYPDRSALLLGVAPRSADDGLLQVREIMGLRLRADLVTLSACDTSLGSDEREAGVVNLEQAFLIAGARAVVASLWNVEDNSTTALMKAFYKHLAEHDDKALALAQAKRDILDRYGQAPPYYWAPFVIVGEAADPIPFGH